MHRLILIIAVMVVIAIAAVSSVKTQRLRSELDQAESRVREMEVKVAELNGERERHLETRAELETLKQQIETVRRESEQSAVRAGELQSANESLNREIFTVQEERRRLEQELRDLRARLENVKESAAAAAAGRVTAPGESRAVAMADEGIPAA